MNNHQQISPEDLAMLEGFDQQSALKLYESAPKPQKIQTTMSIRDLENGQRKYFRMRPFRKNEVVSLTGSKQASSDKGNEGSPFFEYKSLLFKVYMYDKSGSPILDDKRNHKFYTREYWIVDKKADSYLQVIKRTLAKINSLDSEDKRKYLNRHNKYFSTPWSKFTEDKPCKVYNVGSNTAGFFAVEVHESLQNTDYVHPSKGEVTGTASIQIGDVIFFECKQSGKNKLTESGCLPEVYDNVNGEDIRYGDLVTTLFDGVDIFAEKSVKIDPANKSKTTKYNMGKRSGRHQVTPLKIMEGFDYVGLVNIDTEKFDGYTQIPSLVELVSQQQENLNLAIESYLRYVGIDTDGIANDLNLDLSTKETVDLDEEEPTNFDLPPVADVNKDSDGGDLKGVVPEDLFE